MRALVALAVSLAWPGAGQVATPTPQTAEKPSLLNSGKPMVVDYRGSDEDMRAAGLSCTIEDPCAIFLELDSVESVGNRIFVVGNVHTATTTLYSILLASDDAGKTWHEPHERIGAAGLDRIQFIDFEHGWVGGELLHPLPHDPFLLTTSDGGITWRAAPIFGEPQFGSLQQFTFSSRTTGALIIDRGRGAESGRYALYETADGGEVWTMRQSSDKPIPMKRAGSGGNADWRLRADAATRAYRIERRAGEGWHGVASFAVSLGFYRPPEPPSPPAEEPVPPPQTPPGSASLH